MLYMYRETRKTKSFRQMHIFKKTGQLKKYVELISKQ